MPVSACRHNRTSGTELSRVLLWGMAALCLLLNACGGGGDTKQAGQTQVTVSVVQRLAASEADGAQLASADISTYAAGWLLDTLIRQAHAASFAEDFPYLGSVTLQIMGTGFTTASINADFNDNRFPLVTVDGESAMELTDTEVSVTVPDTVVLTFVVTAFNVDGLRIFRGENTLTVSELTRANVDLPIPLMVDIDPRIPRLVAGTGCADEDEDGICSAFEDVFVTRAGVPDIDGDGLVNSMDDNADGDALSDAEEGLGASNDGFPVFVHKNQPPASVENITIAINATSGSEGISPGVSDPDVGDSHAITIVTQPENGMATVVNNLIFYTPNPGFSGSDSFLFAAVDVGGLSRQGTADVSVTGTPTTTTTTTTLSTTTTTTSVATTTSTTTTSTTTTTTTLPQGPTLIEDLVFADANLRQCVLATQALTAEEVTVLNCVATDVLLTDMPFLPNIQNISISSLSGIEALTNLMSFSLLGNNISDLGPLAGLTNLTTLVLVGSNFVDPDLIGNNISDLSPLTGLTKLTLLALVGNSISDLSSLAGIGVFSNLSALFLDLNNISDLSPLAGLTNLMALSLGQNNISNLDPLAGLANLTTLALYENSISNLQPLSGLTNLTELDLDDNNISDVGPLVGLNALTDLYLFNNSITTGVAGLVSLTNAQTIDLVSNDNILCADLDTLDEVLGVGVVSRPGLCLQ